MRYLEHAARHALEFSGHADVRASSFRTGSLLHNLVDDDGTGAASQRFGWATGTWVLVQELGVSCKSFYSREPYRSLPTGSVVVVQ